MLFFLLTIVLSISTHPTIAVDQYAKDGDFPFEVAILYQGKYVCAGAIIVHDFVATAAHCVKEKNYRYLRVLTGTVHGAKFFDENIKIIDRILVHPRYTPSTRDFDIALIKLRDPVRATNVVDIIELPDPDYEIEGGTVATLIYWDFRDGARLSYVDVELWGQDNCTALNIWGEYDYNREVPLTSENTFCASIPPGSCIKNDAGSLVVDNKLLGIVSWNEYCNSTRIPLVFSNMAIYEEWINRIWNDEDKYLG
ncbi:trypsin-1-like [Calliphora vicina]|uniref:trypsin-1-like n=1 Tax=Calliphora vicina TaxID=7373 RepID=UPI00325BBC22